MLHILRVPPETRSRAADYDAGGRLAGIEILDAMRRLGDPEVFRQVILEDVALRTTWRPDVPIALVDLDPAVGHDQRGVRVIVSAPEAPDHQRFPSSASSP